MLERRSSMDNIVSGLTEHFIDLWWECDTGFPNLGTAYTRQEQKQRERELQHHLDRLYDLVRKPAIDREQADETQQRLEQLVTAIFQSALGLKEEHMQAMIGYGFREAIIEFAEMARDFDPSLTDEDIYQAARNSISMNLMQVLLGLPMQVTSSVFAFSMLYPYTDNYLDDPTIDQRTKKAFNERFRKRLAGEMFDSVNQHETQIYKLIDLIENQYERSHYPLVYDSLLAIHAAQARSMRMLQKEASPYEVDVLRTCFLKGGTSALADGYLVAGDLTPEQREFTYYYGAFTQLMDDLEDVHNDRKDGILTIFSQTAGHWPLDKVTNKTIHFGDQVLAKLNQFDGPGLAPLKEMLSICLNPILVDSASCAAPFFTRPYLQELQGYFPFHFSFLKKQRKRFRQKRETLKLLLENLMMIALLPQKP